MFWAFEKDIFDFFWKFLSDEMETAFLEDEADPSRSFKFQVGHRKRFRKWFWIFFELKNECFESLKRFEESFKNVEFFANFWVTKLKPFSGKARQYLENFLCKICFVWSF